MSNLFLEVRRNWPGSEIMIWFISIGAFIAGVLLMWEDTVTSRLGYEALETTYLLNPRTSTHIYWVMSVVPQIAQIMFAYIFFTDMRKNWWALAMAIMFLIIDFSSDVYHTTGALPLLQERSLVAMASTTIFFTIGAELFITLGIGLFQQTTPTAIRELKKFWRESTDATFGSGSARRTQGRSTQSLIDMQNRDSS